MITLQQPLFLLYRKGNICCPTQREVEYLGCPQLPRPSWSSTKWRWGNSAKGRWDNPAVLFRGTSTE